MSLFVICSILQPYALLTISLYVYVFLCINTPVCCMYFTSLNINLATYFSKLALICLKLLLGLTMDSPTLSRPPRFEASIKRVVQPTSWSQCLARLQTRYLRPNSELNNNPLCLIFHFILSSSLYNAVSFLVISYLQVSVFDLQGLRPRPRLRPKPVHQSPNTSKNWTGPLRTSFLN